MSKVLIEEEDAFTKGDKFNHYALVCSISCVLYVGALIINGTIGAKTGKISNERFPLNVVPPGWAFSIWGVIFLSTLVALIWSIITVSWSFQSHLWFWGYCVIISAWIYFWSWATVPGMTISLVLLIALALVLFEGILGFVYALENPAASAMRSTIAFQLGWCASAQCLNFSIWLVYGHLRVPQAKIAYWIWPILALSHAAYTAGAIVSCGQSGKNFFSSFGGYYFSMLWAITGVFISYQKILPSQKEW